MKKNNEHAQALESLLTHEITGVKSLSRLLKGKLSEAVKTLSAIQGKIVVSGVGKSGHIGQKIASTFTSLGIPAIFIHPVEAMHGDLGLIVASDIVLAISHSGETHELLKMLQHVQRRGVEVISITGNPNSTLVKLSKTTLGYQIRNEGSPFNLAPMASTTASLVIGDLLATALSLKAGITKQRFADVHPAGSLGLQLTKVGDVMLMGRQIPLMKDNETFLQVLKKISQKHLGIGGICNQEGKLVGVVTDGDIRRFVMHSGFSLDAPIKKAMTLRPKTITEDRSLHDALHIMETYNITSLFVLGAHQKPVGIIHLHQIVKYQLV